MSDEFTWSTKTAQSIGVGNTSWTTLNWGSGRTEWQWHDGLRIWVHAQLAVDQPPDKANWATWIDFQIVQKLPDKPLDPTALHTATLVKQRTGVLYNVEMDTVPGEIYSLRAQHNAPVPLVLSKRILKVSTNITEVIAR